MVMRQEFDQFELPVKRKVRFFRNDMGTTRFDHVEMSKKSRTRQVWYVKEWLAHKGLRQKDLVSRTHFTKSQVSEYVNGKQRWNEDVLAEFAHAIGVEWQELLIPPVKVDNELAEFVMRMSKPKRDRAMKILKAAIDEDDEKVA